MALTENDVVAAVAKHLAALGWKCTCLTTKDKGIDILAKRDDSPVRYLVEAKGMTSADPASKNYGKPFEPQQIFTHVAKAFHTAASLRGRNPNDLVAIAVPDSRLHKSHLKAIEYALTQLRINAFLVGLDHQIIES
jgi:hypothetical protein